MKFFLQNLEGKYKIATLTIIMILILVLIGLFVSDVTQLTILVIAIITIVFVTVLVLLNKTKNSIRYFSLFILFSTAISLLPPVANPLMKFINALIKSYLPSYATQQPINEVSSLIHFGTLLILLIGVFIVNYFMAKEDYTAMKIHPRLSNLAKILDMDFMVKMVNISKAFSDDIERLDRQLDWSSHYFTPLDAEVLVKTEKDNKRKIADLLTAIKSSKNRLFLLLGEPGSGKSVALRKLAKELSAETKETGKIPIYINLKEWSFERNRIVTVEDLKVFIVSYIKKGSDPIIKQFFFKQIDGNETIFDKLHEYGHIYYLFDSFDEIPQVINSKENTKLISNLSEVLNIFLTGARVEESQGIVASRLYKKPSKKFLAKTILEVRPFNESKIIQTLENIGYRQDDLIKKLFATRPDLVQIAKNPFSAMLIAKYAEKYQHQLPQNQSELFSVFIENSLEELKEEMEEKAVTLKDVMACSIQIANMMFSNDGGLETSIEVLQEKLPMYDIKNIVHILKEARLGRGHIKDANIFSFSHRRIAEYFYVQKLLEDDSMIDFESIPTIGEQRDALVLYCEVAEIEKAKEIANDCWNNIKSQESILNERSVNSLRFLVEAFRNRVEALEDFRDELSEFVLETIKDEKHILILKLLVEALGLLDEENIDIGVSYIFELNNFWLSETAIMACRHLAKISKKLEKNIEDYIYNMGYEAFFPNLKSMLFSFSLTDSFIQFKKICYMKIIDLIVFILVLIYYIYLQYIWENIYIYHLLFSSTILLFAFMFYGFSIIFFKYISGVVFIGFLVNGYYGNFTTDSLLLLLCTGLMAFPFTKVTFSFNDFFKSKNFISKIVSIIVLIIFTIGLKLVDVYYDIISLENFFGIIYMASFLLFVLYIFFTKYFSLIDKLKYKKINFKKLNHRPYIYTVCASLKSYYYKMKLIKYLEENIEEVSGEWTNRDILEVNFQPNIQLAKLEEKWLGLGR